MQIPNSWKTGNKYELDVDLLEEFDQAINTALSPQIETQPPLFNAAVALECLAEQISYEIQDGNVTGFSIQWDGSKSVVVTKSVKSDSKVTLTTHETLQIK